jgi:hypothetical protein
MRTACIIQNTSSQRCRTGKPKNGKRAYVTWMRNNGAPTGLSSSMSILRTAQYLDDAGKVQITAYFLKNDGARVS